MRSSGTASTTPAEVGVDCVTFVLSFESSVMFFTQRWES